MRIIALALAAGLLLATAAPAQQREATPPPAGEAKPVGYLAIEAVDYHGLLQPPPEQGSLTDQMDVNTSMYWQTAAGSARWKTANLDDAFVYPRFDKAFGERIDRAHNPALVTLLNRALKDVANPVFAAKAEYLRLRPYQRYQLKRVCGEAKAPAPNPADTERSSYPSGHAAYGWMTALVLAEIAPERTGPLLARGRDYGLSRVICGVHFPSDVLAGQVAAEAVFARLMRDPEFLAQLSAIQAARRARH